jgi:hypothetical protein
MAESTLSLAYASLVQQIGRYLGYGESASGAQLTDIQRCIAGGLRMFYRAHRWSFLDLSTTLATGTAQTFTTTYATGTFNCTSHGYSDGDTVTFTTTSVLPASLLTGTRYYVRDKATSTFKVALTSGGTAVTLSSDGSGTHSVRKSSWLYDLPETFGTIRGTFHHAAGLNYQEINPAGLHDILALRNLSDNIAQPYWYAIRPKNFTTAATTGQRFEACFYPEPDQAYTLSYQYRANASTLDGSSEYYALGGMEHTETVLWACLAWGEKFFNDEPQGGHFQEYMRLLADSKQQDAERAPESLGKSVDCSTDPAGRGSWRNNPERIEGITYD